MSDNLKRNGDSAAIARLPLEILIKVFTLNMYNCQPNVWYREISRISLVCRQWYDIVESTPSFFTICDSSSLDAALSQILVRSKGQLLDLHYSSGETFWDRLGVHVERWQTLTSIMTPGLLHQLRRGIPSLRRLCITGAAPGASDFVISEDPIEYAPNLQHLDINSLPLSMVGWSRIPFKGLHIMKLMSVGQMTLDHFLIVLQESPQLKELRLDRCNFSDPTNPISGKIPLYSLRDLYFKNVHGGDRSPVQIILDSLEVDHLETLELVPSMRYNQGITEMPSFVMESILKIASCASQLNVYLPSETATISTKGLKIEVGPRIALELPHLFDYLNASPLKFPVHLGIYTLNSVPSSRDTILQTVMAFRGFVHLDLRDRLRSDTHLVLEALSISDSIGEESPLPNLVKLTLHLNAVGTERMLAFLRSRYGNRVSPLSPLVELALKTDHGHMDHDLYGAAQRIVGPGVVRWIES